MNNSYRKIIRTLMVYFPLLKRVKASAQRAYHNSTRTAFEQEFYGLRLFPDRTDDLYLDVGGNHGLAVGAIRIFKPSCNIISFEPNEALAVEIERSCRKDRRIKVYPCGLGEKGLELPLYVPVYRGIPFDGLASFIPENVIGCLDSKDLLFFDRRKLVIRESISRIITLDSLNLDPFFIKLDVQGFELSVLKGAEETIRKSRPVLLIESVNDEHMQFLGKFGYNIYAYDRAGNSFVKGASRSVNSFVMTEDKFELACRRETAIVKGRHLLDSSRVHDGYSSPPLAYSSSVMQVL